MMPEVELIEDVVRMLNKARKVYGKKGQKVKVISIHGDVLIVEGKERFPVHISKTKSNGKA